MIQCSFYDVDKIMYLYNPWSFFNWFNKNNSVALTEILCVSSRPAQEGLEIVMSSKV